MDQSRDTSNIGHTRYRTKTIQRHQQHWAHKTQDKDNPETLATLGTQDTRQRQSRDTSNIGHTRHRTKTIKRHQQHWAHKTQDEDNPETLATLGTQDTGQRQTKRNNTTQKTKQMRATLKLICPHNRFLIVNILFPLMVNDFKTFFRDLFWCSFDLSSRVYPRSSGMFLRSLLLKDSALSLNNPSFNDY